MRTLARALLVAALTLGACGKDAPPPPAKPAEPKKPVDKSTWKEIETPVPVGTKLSCARLLPADKLEAALGKKVSIVDESARDGEATAVCRLFPVDKKGKQGDELCLLTFGCWQQWTVPDVKKKCDARGDATSTDLGAFSCVQTVTAGPHERHIVTVLDGDTRCRILANAGPSTYDVEATRSCARVAADLLDKDSLKP